jgi:hypothetical protein
MKAISMCYALDDINYDLYLTWIYISFIKLLWNYRVKKTTLKEIDIWEIV